MRKLMWFTIGFGAGCFLCAYCLENEWILPAFLASAAVCLAALLFTGKAKTAQVISMSLFGLTISFGWFTLFYQGYLRDAVFLDGREQAAAITVTDYSYETAYGIGFDGSLELNGKPYQVRAYLDEEASLSPGDTVQGLFRFRITIGDGEDAATYHPGKGIFLLAYQEGDAQLHHIEESPVWTVAARLRQSIKTILETSFPEDTVSFAKALLLGDIMDLSYETDTSFKLSGIRHVVAVSGLHISILFTLISAVTFRKRYLTALLGIPVLCLFAAVAGFTPSVVRASIMSGLMLLSLLFDKEYDGPTALSFAVLAMLTFNPLAITSVSLQLSVASVAGIFLFREGIQNWIISLFVVQKEKTLKARLIKWLSASVAITLSAMTLTTPLCAIYFGTVSLIGVVTNLLTLWVISFVFYGIMAVCLLHFVWQGGAALLAKIISLPIRYILIVAKGLGNLPLASVYTASIYIVAWLVFCYILLVIFLCLKNRRPLVFGCCAVIGLCAALLASWLEPLTDDCRMTVLDVGQGQAILLQSEGRTYLVDCGGDSDTETADLIAGTLLSQGVDCLDGIILTHYDRDHAGALENLLTRIPADLLLLPNTENAQLYPQTGGNTLYVTDQLEIAFGGAKLSVFGPIYAGDDNENSMCILFERENCAILITGDRSAFGERMLMRKTDLPDVNVLIAGHHGSHNSTSEELLAAVTPETVIISAGEDNRYGHPAPALLDRLRQFGCTVYRTDIHGTIIYRR